MPKSSTSEDQYSPEETERRLQKTLKTAFNMKPTPLKDIPRKRKVSRTKQATVKGSKAP